jgi:hypothetical protein
VSGPRSGTRFRRAAGAVLLAAAAITCESKTGPDVPVAIEFPPPQLPSLVKGDQLRDTLGNIDSLHAIVFNSSGDTIHGAPVRFIHADTTHIVDIDSITGHVMAIDTGFARVVAQAGSLQSPPDTLFVVERPDAFVRVTSPNDTLAFTPVRADTLFPLSVLVNSNSHPVNRYRVEYRFIYPADLNTPDSTRVLLTDANRKFSLVDTTGVGATAAPGTATRYLRISPFAHPFNDTVVVEARSFLPDHTPVPGSPLRFKVLVQIQ